MLAQWFALTYDYPASELALCRSPVSSNIRNDCPQLTLRWQNCPGESVLAMYCAACNLHYPDHLSFCRRCGQALVRSTAELPIESLCCTRCGARSIRGENFCQQCGTRVGAPVPETVIGACYHCGMAWRTGWLFCKNCGLDRDRALLLSTSTPVVVNPQAKPAAPVEEPPEIAKVRCQYCGAEAKPFSRFCEACGRTLDGGNSGKVNKQTPTGAFRTQTEPPSPKARVLEKEFTARPTLIDPPAPPVPVTNFTPPEAEPKALVEPLAPPKIEAAEQTVITPATVEPKFTPPAPEPPPVVSAEPPKRPSAPLPGQGTPADNLPISSRSENFAAQFPTPNVNVQRSRRRSPLVLLLLLAVLALGSVLAWRFLSRSSSTPTDSSARTSPTAKTENTTTPKNSPPSPAAAAAPAGMSYIPGGQFLMGRNDGDKYESPAHDVTVKPFYMDRTEVTNEEYHKFVEATGHRPPPHWKDKAFPPGEAQFPVVNVSWDDAQAYAQWANKRLPSEEEWEFAARGADGRLYPWGNNWEQNWANANRERGGQVSAVGSYSQGASPFGLQDMCGNVWEWTSSNLVNYAKTNEEIALGKVIRGGAYDVPRDRATATYRGVLPTDRLRDKTGFRCVRDVK
ncbi:MAG: SUMF1/EgtB/PvdO family nonheme iron enzyme [Acidobacteria bacterium]|nr:SUMF1/EgtB/PvdO family nonheme iron enzyme [Acidobacteriota bacterium]